MRTRIIQALMILFLVPFMIAAVVGIGIILTLVVAVGTFSRVRRIFPHKTY